MDASTSRSHPLKWMCVYRSILPKTRPFPFDQLLPTKDQGTLDQLNKISKSREEMRIFLDQEHAASTVTAIERYLPDFLGLLSSMGNQSPDKIPQTNKFKWTAPLGRHLINSTHDTTSTTWEINSTLMAYALAMRNQAAESIKGITELPHLEAEKRINTVSSLLTKAAGVFDHLGNSMERVPPDAILPETSPSMLSALSSLSLAEAEEAAVVKGLMKNVSYGAIAKLAADIYTRLDHVTTVLRTAKIVDLTSQDLLSFVTVKSMLWKILTHQFLGENQFAQGNYGLSIQYMRAAKSLAEQKVNASDATLSSILNQQLQEVKKMEEKLTQDNDNIYFSNLPGTSLPPIENTSIVKPTPFTPFPPSQLKIVYRPDDSSCLIQ
ncbi:ALG-2 interacting protein X [Planoprotostelium fungivorum]|uniref:ALG-2 interacting protein X n=1 Tax=Planoprotostelium fungivorum TaxID=1890364 RepID=A0A2P6NKX8_9EUKA|nr:ALG-2 interacting protein X [Planoprotostelium fungivorum]